MRDLRNKFTLVAACIFAAVFIFMGYLKVQSVVIGLYTSITITPAEVRDMQRFARDYMARFDSLTPAQRHEMEREKLKYEIKILNALEPFIKALDRANQIGT